MEKETETEGWREVELAGESETYRIVETVEGENKKIGNREIEVEMGVFIR